MAEAKAEVKERVVKPKEPVEIEYTDAAKHNKPGSRATVHAALAEQLVNKGVANLVEGGTGQKKPSKK